MYRTLQRPLVDLALANAILDRADRLRDDELAVAALWEQPESQLLVMYGRQVPVGTETGGPRLVLDQPRRRWPVMPDRALFLGLDDDVAYFAYAADGDPRQYTQLRGLRDVGAELPALDRELVCTTLALVNWHCTHEYCSTCGIRTDVARVGWVRRCPADKSEHYPRTDPAVIMLVTNEHDEALLGHRGPWAPGWFSTLAGFVEPGESAESAVIRELAEEVSIKVDPDSIVCLGSQPWPFPSSLMIGFRARATPGQVPTPDGTEITEARWFGRDELRAACEAGSVSLPARLSISRHLIEDWFGAELPGSWGR